MDGNLFPDVHAVTQCSSLMPSLPIVDSRTEQIIASVMLPPDLYFIPQLQAHVNKSANARRRKELEGLKTGRGHESHSLHDRSTRGVHPRCRAAYPTTKQISAPSLSTQSLPVNGHAHIPIEVVENPVQCLHLIDSGQEKILHKSLAE